MMAHEETSQIKKNTGRTGIGHLNRTKRSMRAAEGKIEVVRKTCPECGHHKMIKNNTLGPVVRKCCKCPYKEWA